MTTLAERMATLESAMWGRDGRGGMVDEISEINTKLDQVVTRLAWAGWSVTLSAIGIAAAILTHTV